MILIAHRGNQWGPDPRENQPQYIAQCIADGIHAEIDVWCINNKWFLGHDEPIYQINYEFLTMPNLWLHCKNYAALYNLIATDLNYFWHQSDDYALTAHGYIWAYPNKVGRNNTIAVMPETGSLVNSELEEFEGICSDFPHRYGSYR